MFLPLNSHLCGYNPAIKSRSLQVIDHQNELPCTCWQKWPPLEARAQVTLDTLTAHLNAFTATFKASAVYEGVCNLFSSHVLQNRNITITSCMCLALGSPSAEEPSTHGKSYNNAMSQLVVFESLIDLLSKSYQARDMRTAPGYGTYVTD